MAYNNCKSLKVIDTILNPGTDFTFVIEPPAYQPRCRYTLVVNMDWGDATGAEVVYISDGTQNNRLLDCIADRMRVAELRRCCRNCNRVELVMVYGADSADGVAHFQIKGAGTGNNCIPTFVATAPEA